MYLSCEHAIKQKPKGKPNGNSHRNESNPEAPSHQKAKKISREVRNVLWAISTLISPGLNFLGEGGMFTENRGSLLRIRKDLARHGVRKGEKKILSLWSRQLEIFHVSFIHLSPFTGSKFTTEAQSVGWPACLFSLFFHASHKTWSYLGLLQSCPSQLFRPTIIPFRAQVIQLLGLHLPCFVVRCGLCLST